MAKFGYNSPEGPIEVEADSQEAADQMLITKIIPDMEAQKRKVSPRPNRAPYRANPPPAEVYNPVEGMNTFDKFTAGYTGDAKNMYLGAKNFLGLGTPEEQEERQQWQKLKPGLGTAGTLGGGTAEAVITAPLGGPIGKVGKVLTKAVPMLGKVAGLGTRAMNIGTVARGAAEGALTQGIVGDPTDQGMGDRLDDMMSGAGYGGAAPIAIGALSAPFKGAGMLTKSAWNAMAPTKGAAQRRAFNAFKNELGDEGLENAQRAIRDSGTSVLPRTTAAMTGDQGLAALEKGAANRRNADFASHYEDVGRTAWKNLARTPARNRTEAGQMLQDTFDRGGIIQTPNVIGKDPMFQVPSLESHPLRRALGKLQNGMSDTEVAKAKNLAAELGNYEAARYGAGSAVPKMGHGGDLVQAGLAVASIGAGSPTLWKVRSMLGNITSTAKDKTFKEIDQALLDPKKFMDLTTSIQAKLNKGEHLTFGEHAFQEAVLGVGRQAAIQSPQENQNAP